MTSTTNSSGASLHTVLKEQFGFNSFRPYQEPIIQDILGNRDTIAILPTGSGKSLCYQVPAVLNSGTTIVISPLISLMQNQVDALTKLGISATVYNSSLDAYDRAEIEANLSAYKLIYIAPERFADATFMQRLQETPPSLFVIDEAHCISQWGHAFRPDYRALAILKQTFPNTPITAFTATATGSVAQDIQSQLKLHNPACHLASFDRPNLSLRISERHDMKKQLKEFLKDQADNSGIIYASTRKKVDTLHDWLGGLGYSVTKYHAGMSNAARSAAQKSFQNDDCPLIVATVAFGMGIDKPNVRFVFHVDMPSSMENYYQEIGRAGRDGLPAQCHMLYSLQDLMLQKRFQEDIPEDSVRLHRRRMIDQLFAFCSSAVCRRIDLLQYFGEDYTEKNCQNCDNCLDITETIDGTIIAQKILSCVYRLQQRFGISYVIDVLCGASLKQLLARGHDQLSTYGLLKEMPKVEVRHYIFSLINMGHLYVTEDQYPILRLTQKSRDVLKGDVPIRFIKRQFKDNKKAKSRKKQGPIDDLNESDQALYQSLKALRKEIADQNGVPPYVIFHDRTLLEMAATKPQTSADFLELNGVGQVKLDTYGAQFMAALK